LKLAVHTHTTVMYFDFNPLRAKELEAECSIEDITKAMMAREAYHKPKNE